MISKWVPRVIRRSVSSQAQNIIPVTCRGKIISRDEVFQYNNGHFLLDEKHQYTKRYIRFDIDKLCDIVASAASNGTSPVYNIDKMEGGFHKALMMTLESGTEAVAKIPCLNAGRPMYSTASEAAVLEYVRSQTTIPVPKVLAWNSDSTNPIGAEYIIMEKAKGIQLYRVWGGLSELDRLKIIQNLTLLEKQLTSLHFPVYGNLYFRESIPGSSCTLLEKNVDPSGSYCIGPAADISWLGDQATNQSANQNYDLGPWSDLQTFGEAFTKRDLNKNSVCRTQGHFMRQSPNYGSREVHTSVLESAMKVLPEVSGHKSLAESSRPTLLHTDLHMGNIFVSEQDPTTITSIIDWHSTLISPMFMQARWPVFLEPPEYYDTSLALPQLPSNFDQMDAEEKEAAVRAKNLAFLSKAYEVSTARYNDKLYDALHVPPLLKELFVRCGDTSVDGIIPLRSCLIRLFQNWQDLGLEEPCPLHFTEEELLQHKEEYDEYQDWATLQETVKNVLDTDADGWISPEVDWEEKQGQNQQLQELFIKRTSVERTAEEARKSFLSLINRVNTTVRVQLIPMPPFRSSQNPPPMGNIVQIC